VDCFRGGRCYTNRSRGSMKLHQLNSALLPDQLQYPKDISLLSQDELSDLALATFAMAVRLLESRFESLTVNDENEPPANNGPTYHKSKVYSGGTSFNAVQLANYE